MIKMLQPKRHDVVHGISSSCSLHALKNTVELEAEGCMVIGESFHSLVGAEHFPDKLLVRLQDLFFV
jgi:hypothetical protein